MADAITKPLLLIHGEEDNNTGTFPLQSERFYAALKGARAAACLVAAGPSCCCCCLLCRARPWCSRRVRAFVRAGAHPCDSARSACMLHAGHGSPARLVLLPHEGHGYRARESVLHTLYEQYQWLERYAGYGRLDPDYVTSSGEADGTVSGSLSE